MKQKPLLPTNLVSFSFFTNFKKRLIQNFAKKEGGDRQKAMKRLRVPPLGERKSDLTTLKVGFFTGAFVCLFVTMVVSGNISCLILQLSNSVVIVMVLQPYFTRARKIIGESLFDFTVGLC